MEVNSENIQFDPFCLVGDHHREDVRYIDKVRQLQRDRPVRFNEYGPWPLLGKTPKRDDPLWLPQIYAPCFRVSSGRSSSTISSSSTRRPSSPVLQWRGSSARARGHSEGEEGLAVWCDPWNYLLYFALNPFLKDVTINYMLCFFSNNVGIFISFFKIL